MRIYLSGFSLSGGLDAFAPTGGPLRMSPPLAQTPPAGFDAGRIGGIWSDGKSGFLVDVCGSDQALG